MVDSVAVRFKKCVCRKNAFNKHSYAGTACVSECVLKTLACQGLRVSPSKFLRGVTWIFWESLRELERKGGRGWKTY